MSCMSYGIFVHHERYSFAMDSHHLFIAVSGHEEIEKYSSDKKWPKEIETKVKNLKSFICLVDFVLLREYDNDVASFFLPFLCYVKRIVYHDTTRHKRSHNAISGSKMTAIFH